MPDSEMGKRSLLRLISPARTTFFYRRFAQLSVFYPPQWKTRWLVLRKPSPVAGNLIHTLDFFHFNYGLSVLSRARLARACCVTLIERGLFGFALERLKNLRTRGGVKNH